MANTVVPMQITYKQEVHTKYTGYDGTLYVLQLRSEDNALGIEFIWASAPAPNGSTNFDAMTNGSLIFDTDNSGLIYYKNAAASFAKVGDLT